VLANLGDALGRIANLHATAATWTKPCVAFDAAVAATPEPGSHRSGRLDGLANALSARAHPNDDVDLLGRAIAAREEALAGLAPSAPLARRIMVNLSRNLLLRWRLTRNAPDLEHAHTPGPPLGAGGAR
jgi:hypothetical protein